MNPLRSSGFRTTWSFRLVSCNACSVMNFPSHYLLDCMHVFNVCMSIYLSIYLKAAISSSIYVGMNVHYFCTYVLCMCQVGLHTCFHSWNHDPARINTTMIRTHESDIRLLMDAIHTAIHRPFQRNRFTSNTNCSHCLLSYSCRKHTLRIVHVLSTDIL